MQIKTLTPLWTGNVDGKCKTIKETGIIGSLRWWYEALVRGLGGYACDPTSDKRCELNYKKFDNSIKNGRSIQESLDEQICPVCQLFGCTGWKRRFKLELNSEKLLNAPFIIAKPNESQRPVFLGYYDKTGKAYKNKGGLVGGFEFDLIPENEGNIDLLGLLLQLSIDWGLGAMTQKGFGVLSSKENFKNGEKDLSNLPKPRNENTYSLPLPKIDQFFFYKVPIKTESIGMITKEISKGLFKTMSDKKKGNYLEWDYMSFSYIPSAPWVKRSIRSLYSNKILRHYLMGFVSMKETKPIHLKCWKHSIKKDKRKYWCVNCREGSIDKLILEKTASKIHVSHIYNQNFYKTGKPSWEMKLWGWIPEIPKKIGVDEKTVQKILKSNLVSVDFWENTFGVEKCPVDVDNILSVWGPY